MKAFKAFIKPFEAPQRSVKIKIYVNFFSSYSGCRFCKLISSLNISMLISVRICLDYLWKKLLGGFCFALQ